MASAVHLSRQATRIKIRFLRVKIAVKTTFVSNILFDSQNK